MASHKVGRATEEIRRELPVIMRSLKDPRISGMLSIVAVDLTNDFSYCTVYISSLEGMEQSKEACKGLASAAGFIRREIGKRLDLRRLPEFQFLADDGIAYAANIGKILGDLNVSKEEEQ